MKTRYPYQWRTRTRLASRFGEACRVLVGGKDGALVEFQDGFRTLTTLKRIRLAKAT